MKQICDISLNFFFSVDVLVSADDVTSELCSSWIVTPLVSVACVHAILCCWFVSYVVTGLNVFSNKQMLVI